jgi:hypothetical protein
VLVVASAPSASPLQAKPRTAAAAATDGTTLLRNRGGQSARYTGVGQLEGVRTCTAWLVETVRRAPAYAISSGRCSTSSPSETIVNRKAKGMTIEFRRFVDTSGARLKVRVKRIVFASAKGLDLSIYALGPSLRAFRAKGVQPLRIAPGSPGGGRKVETVGIPVAGVGRKERMLRRSGCTTRPRTKRLLEDSWVWYHVIPSNCRGIVGGSLGSPLIDRRSGNVLGVINTTTLFGDRLPACSSGRPCEIRGGDSLRPRRNTTYAIPTSGLRACISLSGRFRLGGACPLDRRPWLTSTAPPVGVNPDVPDPVTGLPQTTWNVRLAGRLAYYRTKVGPAGTTDCRTSDGYGTPVALAQAPTYDAPLPLQNGRWVLCIVAGPTPQPDQRWQPVGKATTIVRYIDRSRPTQRIRVRVRESLGGSTVEPVLDLPDHAHFAIKIGPLATALCTDPAGYHTYTGVPFRIPPTQQPARVCIRSWDEAGNEAMTIWQRPVDGR